MTGDEAHGQIEDPIGEDEERQLRDREHHLVSFLDHDPRLLKIAHAEGITADAFRDPNVVRIYARVVKDGPRPDERRDLIGATHVRKWSRQLVEAAPRRPAWVKQPQLQQGDERHPEPPAATAMRRPRPNPAPAPPMPNRTPPDHHVAEGYAATTTTDGAEERRIEQAWRTWERGRKKVTGKLAKMDRDKRKSQLNHLRWHLAKKFPTVDAWIANLKTRCFGGRDPLDRHDVNDYELGRAIGLSLEGIFDLEEKVTASGLAKGWTTRKGDPFRFRITVIAPYDATPAERTAARIKRRHDTQSAIRSALRAEKRKENTTMQTQQATSYATYAEIVAAQKAATKGQCKAILAMLDRERNVAELMGLLADHPAWCALAGVERRFHQTMLDRLNMLRKMGLIMDRYGKGRRGSRPRFVRKTPAAPETDDGAAQESVDETPF